MQYNSILIYSKLVMENTPPNKDLMLPRRSHDNSKQPVLKWRHSRPVLSVILERLARFLVHTTSNLPNGTIKWAAGRKKEIKSNKSEKCRSISDWFVKCCRKHQMQNSKKSSWDLRWWLLQSKQFLSDARVSLASVSILRGDLEGGVLGAVLLTNVISILPLRLPFCRIFVPINLQEKDMEAFCGGWGKESRVTWPTEQAKSNNFFLDTSSRALWPSRNTYCGGSVPTIRDIST